MELRLIFAVICILLSQAVFAGIEEYRFDDPEAQARFRRLAAEYTCIGCQDGSLAETSSLQAIDLRTQIYRMIAKGKSDKEIRDFLVYRYSDQVLYKQGRDYSPFIKWGTPLIALLIAGSFLAWFYRCTRV